MTSTTIPAARRAAVPATAATFHELVVIQRLAARWPVGARVRHKHSMWLGAIVPGDPAQCPGIWTGYAPAHCYIPAAVHLDQGAVCVQWDHPDQQPGAPERGPLNDVWPHPRIGPAWIRPGILRLVRERERRTR